MSLSSVFCLLEFFAPKWSVRPRAEVFFSSLARVYRHGACTPAVVCTEGRRREARRQTGPVPSNVADRRRTANFGAEYRGGGAQGDVELIRLKCESDVEDASTPAEVMVAAQTDNDAETLHVDDRHVAAP